MKKLTLILILVAGVCISGFCAEALSSIVKFASVEKAISLLSQEDDYTKKWSRFDIESRLNTKNGTKEELFRYISEQAREWTDSEKAKISAIIKDIENLVAEQKLNISFPDEIFFVKTTCLEEGGALGYTRANYVVLKDDVCSGSDEQLTYLIIHELFHILTRNDNNFRKSMYEIIGFDLMNEVEYPDKIKESKITNPDAPKTDSYIKLKYQGRPIECMMILYSDEEYDGGAFFEYLNIGLLGLQGGSVKSAEYTNGVPSIYSLEEIADTDFFEQIGRNTSYIIHPEEILADNFAYAILARSGLPNPEIVDKIIEQLRK